MPYYYPLKRLKAAERRRAAEGLARLRAAFIEPQVPGIAPIPARTANQTLLLATWNLREFGAGKAGPRSREALYYIAEIISRFDLVAVQEIRESLGEFEQLRDILGSRWQCLYTDVSLGRQGNNERAAFLYDSSKVRFCGLAGELVLDERNLIDQSQFARTPYVCQFQVGWASFSLCTVHIYYGDSKADNPRRVAEIGKLSKLLGELTKPKNFKRWGETQVRPASNVILLGDFNIFANSDKTMKALESGGFRVAPELQSLPGSNVDKSKKYDQIAIGRYKNRIEPTGRAGVFDFFEYVYRKQDEALYADAMAASPGGGSNGWSYCTWRTYMMSDHLPLWQEFRVDFADEYIAELGG